MKQKITIIAFIGMLTSLRAFGLEASRLLPFQGRLTDQNGFAVSNGLRLVQFKIYDVPTGGSPVWAGELHRTTVNGGLVNVLLGSKTPFTGLDFNQQLYLEITVDINEDNAITAADPPMLPRQAILPVIFAKEAAVARDAIAAMDSARLAGRTISEVADFVLPRGVVVMWSGSATNLPRGWALCDGSQGTPDLRGRFVVGLDQGDAEYDAPWKTGGARSVALTVSQMPSHSHGATGNTTINGSHQHTFIETHLIVQPSVWTIAASSQNIYNIIDQQRTTASAGDHSHNLNLTIDSTGSGQPHENRPPYFTLAYIMKL